MVQNAGAVGEGRSCRKGAARVSTPDVVRSVDDVRAEAFGEVCALLEAEKLRQDDVLAELFDMLVAKVKALGKKFTRETSEKRP